MTPNPDKAKEVAVPYGSISNGAFESGDELSLKILTRIGTNPDGTQYSGHSNAVGLRLYYNAISRPLRIDPEAHTLIWPNGADFDPATLHDWPKYLEDLKALAKRWALAATPSYRDR